MKKNRAVIMVFSLLYLIFTALTNAIDANAIDPQCNDLEVEFPIFQVTSGTIISEKDNGEWSIEYNVDQKSRRIELLEDEDAYKKIRIYGFLDEGISNITVSVWNTKYPGSVNQYSIEQSFCWGPPPTISVESAGPFEGGAITKKPGNMLNNTPGNLAISIYDTYPD